MGHGQHVRKRRRHQSTNGHVALKRFVATAIILVSAAGFAIETGRDSYSAQSRSSTTFSGPTNTTLVPVSSTSTSTSTTLVTTTDIPVSARIEDPFHSAALAAYLATRTDNVTAALYNVTTHATYIYRPDIDEVTASMEKIDILAVLLWECQNAHRALTAKEMSLATKMIEYSDNNAAEQLWVDDGQLPSVTKFNDDLHYSQSITNWDWGLFDTTPHDQLNLLKTILFPNK